jgi:hypothetical protein
MAVTVQNKENLRDAFKKFVNLPKNDQERLIALEDCIFFGEKYIKPYDAKWTSKTAQFHREMINDIFTYKRVQIHVPFEHAKSTWISIVFPLWQICKNHDVQILLIGSTPKLVLKCLQTITWHIEHNKLLKRDFPKLKKDEQINKWTDTQIYVKRESRGKDPTIEVTSLGGTILGGRFDFIIGDDVCDKKNMNTKNLRDKAWEIWKDDVTSRCVEDGHIANIGTLQHKDDLGVRLGKSKTYHYIRRQAIIDEQKKITLWPDRFSYERLMEIKKDIGSILFLKSYQNEIKSLTGGMFSPDWLHYYDEDKIDISQLRIYFGVDLDIAEEGILEEEKSSHSWFVIAVLGWHPLLNLIYVLKTYYDVLSFPQQIQQLHMHTNLYSPIKMGIEEVYYQKALKQQAFLEGLKAIGVKQTSSKHERIVARSADYEIGRLRVHKSQIELIHEFTSYPDDDVRNDVLDAVDIGCRLIPTRVRQAEVTGGKV